MQTPPMDETQGMDSPSPSKTKKVQPEKLSTVLKAELDQVDARRERLDLKDPNAAPPGPTRPPGGEDTPGDPALEAVLEEARKKTLVGLAFSGGGIRSATFNLGLLQGLADLGLLPLIDYLSTVSGGGYIGSWLAALIQRGGGLKAAQRRLALTPPEKQENGEAAPADVLDPVGHLRRYSNYLAPRQGYLSADTWVLWAAYLRNFLLNQFVLLPAVVAVLLVARLVMLLYYPWSSIDTHSWLVARLVMLLHYLWSSIDTNSSIDTTSWSSEDPPTVPTKVAMAVTAVLVGVLWFVALVFIIRATAKVRLGGAKGPDQPDRRITPGWVLALTLVLLVGAVLFCAFTPYRLTLRDHLDELHLSWTQQGGWGVELAAFAFSFGLLAFLSYLAAMLLPGRGRFLNRAWSAAVMFLAGALGGAMLYGVYVLLHDLFAWNGMLAKDYVRVIATARVMTLGPPLVLGVFVLAIYVGVGLLRQHLREELREWWSSVCARLLLAAAGWLAVTLVALYGTALVLWAGPWVGTVLGSGWLLTVAGGVLAGGGPGTGTPRPPNPLLDRIARVTPSVFMAGLLVAISLLLHVVIDNPPQWKDADETVWVRQREPERPPTRVVTSSTRKPDQPAAVRERQDITERAEVVNDADIVQQMYWVGILNTDPTFVPWVECYSLNDKDLAQLSENHVPPNITKALRPCCIDTQEKFEKSLDQQLLEQFPEGISYANRAAILQHAKKVKSMKVEVIPLLVKLFGWLAVCALVLVVATWRVDVNLFSLHALYGNRLVRCYLGASRPDGPGNGGSGPHGQAQPPGQGPDSPRRWPDPVTEFDPDDDLRLARLRTDRMGGSYDGPFLIVNTAMNLVHGDRLDWQERKAESFVLTSLHCGSLDTGYRPTVTGEGDLEEREGYGGNLRLGTAVALSGAAASPNMGYHSSPAVTALLTVFNARLGAWLGNPASPTRWKRSGPAFGFVHLFRELFGWTRAKGGYVYLSDGGHFENLGVYELVRRRCRYVIVSDAGQDGVHRFEDLGNLIHKCRVDFGIDIEIDLGSLRRGEQGYCRWHCAVGRIRYDNVDAGAAPGTLIYIKPCLTGDEPADVLHYALQHPSFPHDTTANQFYNESQFESYRALGRHIVGAVFDQSVAEMQEELARDGLMKLPLHHRQAQVLFASIVRRWFALPPEYESTFVESTHGFIGVQEAFREDQRLGRLTLDLYPELDPDQEMHRALPEETAEQKAARRCAELHIILQMLQVMENAWLSLNLEVHYAHPLNRGWLDVFHRWTKAETVRRAWPFLRSELSRGFVSFCEKQMGLDQVVGKPVRIRSEDLTPPRLTRLCQELQDEWPTEWDTWLRKRVQHLFESNGHVSWLVYPEKLHLPEGAPPPNSSLFPCGIILLSPADQPDTRELFVWMRGAYRNSGLGRDAVATVLKELHPKGGSGPSRLRVRLPVGDLRGPGGELQKRMWLTFFFHHDFVQVSSPREAAHSAQGNIGAEIVLERDLPPDSIS